MAVLDKEARRLILPPVCGDRSQDLLDLRAIFRVKYPHEHA